MAGFLYMLRVYARRLWIRTGLLTGLAFLSLLTAPLLAPVLPRSWSETITREEVRALLDILANSMLAVTTFSVATMVSAHLAADQSASPRAHRLLREDGRTQTALATFVGAFVYALATIVLIQMELLTDDAMPVAFGVTILVVLMVIVTILRWIERLAALGSVEATTRTAAQGAMEALRRLQQTPFLGGSEQTVTHPPPDDGHTVSARDAGYLTFVDVQSLSTTAGAKGASVWMAVSPGDWIGPGDALLYIDCEELDDDLEEELRDACHLEETRTLEQDAGFGLTVLAEIAERALSPGINDPQTAIDVTSRLLSMLVNWGGEVAVEKPECPNVYVRPLDTYGLLSDSFEPIARDGRSFVEVQVAVQRALARLSRHRDSGIAEAARIVSHRALSYAEIGLMLDADRARVRKIAPVDQAAPARIQPTELTVGQEMTFTPEG